MRADVGGRYWLVVWVNTSVLFEISRYVARMRLRDGGGLGEKSFNVWKLAMIMNVLLVIATAVSTGNRRHHIYLGR